MANSFEDLFIRQQAKWLFLAIHEIFAHSEFREYYFRDQILRATLSISNNIAEGYERVSHKEEKQFFAYAKWSCGEVRSMLIIAVELWYIDDSKKKILIIAAKKISAWLQKLISNSS